MGQLISSLLFILCILFGCAIIRFWWTFNKWLIIGVFFIFIITVYLGSQ